MSHRSAPSGNDEAVHAEVHETPAEKFSMEENACYEGIKSKSTDFKKENSLAQYQACKGVFVALMIALLLLLGTISACIAFAVEISKLKTEMSSLQMESASQQSLNALETELENLTQQLNASVMSFNKQQSQSHNILDEKIELLNSSSHEQLHNSWN